MPKNTKSTEALLSEISEKLDKMMSLIAIQGKDTDIQIDVLRGFGWEWEEIGKLVGLKADAARKRYERKN